MLCGALGERTLRNVAASGDTTDALIAAALLLFVCSRKGRIPCAGMGDAAADACAPAAADDAEPARAEPSATTGERRALERLLTGDGGGVRDGRVRDALDESASDAKIASFVAEENGAAVSDAADAAAEDGAAAAVAAGTATNDADRRERGFFRSGDERGEGDASCCSETDDEADAATIEGATSCMSLSSPCKSLRFLRSSTKYCEGHMRDGSSFLLRIRIEWRNPDAAMVGESYWNAEGHPHTRRESISSAVDHAGTFSEQNERDSPRRNRIQIPLSPRFVIPTTTRSNCTLRSVEQNGRLVLVAQEGVDDHHWLGQLWQDHHCKQAQARGRQGI